MGFASAKSLAAEGSAIAKAIAVAETIYNTQKAVMAAMTLPPPMNAIQAGITGVMGAAAVAKILSTNPEGVEGGGGGGVGGGGGAVATPPAPQMMSGSFDFTSSQNGLEILRRRATI